MRTYLNLIYIIFIVLYGRTLYGADIEPESETTHNRYCLSIDGGGLRGAFPASVLEYMENETKKSVSALFKAGITGTSTGALLALGIAARKSINPQDSEYNTPLLPAKDLVDFYKVHAQGIFKCWTPDNCCHNFPDCSEGKAAWLKQTVWGMLTCFGCCGCCYNCGGLCGPQYSNSYLKNELRKTFENRTLKDVLVPVQIVTYDATGNTPLYLSSITHPDVSMVDAALASAAAPTYFPPYKFEIPGKKGVHYRCVDGGVFENTPILAALGFAVDVYKKKEEDKKKQDSRYEVKEADLRDFKIFSIGTGEAQIVTNFSGLLRSGKLGWAPSVIQIAMNGTSKASDLNMRKLFGRRQDGRHYFRIHPILPERYAAMDDPEVVEYLCRASETEVKSDDFKEILDELRNPRILASQVVEQLAQSDRVAAVQFLAQMQDREAHSDTE